MRKDADENKQQEHTVNQLKRKKGKTCSQSERHINMKLTFHCHYYK